ncbi:hypothetical protein E1B28_001843 [Marasmius oreades]|uniref:RING-type E3 ubiquitin transferase n=1 Tax=Marasmius oreades TaxID=181124 RepID=A0A9P7V4A8_9AGAR|nr:uncharacterized protein E1B28_001843 [Marasmius oreades]KAG7100058.1 hypothetical protein E1B28_001843 [Marasmius oreades]
MSTTTATTRGTKQSRGGRGGRGGNRGKGRGSIRGADIPSKKEENGQSISPPVTDVPSEKKDTAKPEEAEKEEEEAVCWICAEPVKYYSVSACNHRTCHVCALRLRALYKKKDCTFCKEPQPTVIFTVSEDQPFSEYNTDEMVYKDERLSIVFETEEMMEETLILLRFNCPDTECDYIAKGWSDLKLHVRAHHNKLMCDLCIRMKKVFAHELPLYTYAQLIIHLPSINRRSNQKQIPKEDMEGGIHPLCEFCRECFFSGDELYPHMRERHEECFICKRNEVRDQYFQDYASLENHFNSGHYPCTDSACLAQKFVVFNTPIDLQAHMVETHGGGMSARDRKDARRVQTNFEFEEVPGSGRARARGRERDPPPRPRQQPPPPAQPPARPPGPGRRKEGFVGALTVEGGGDGSPAGTPRNGATPPGLSGRNSPSPPLQDVDHVVIERHTAFIERLQSFAPNPSSGVPVVKAAIRSYRASESSARDLISTIFNVLDCHLEHTASIINSFVDLLDEEDKKQDLLSSWKGFEVAQRRQFPELVPTSLGSGYAGITSGRVLNAKNSTHVRINKSSSRTVWDRVAQAAGSSSSSLSAPSLQQRPPDRFPPLRASATTTSRSSANQRKTPWVSSNFTPQTTTSSTQPQQAIYSVPGPSASSLRNSQPPPKLSKAMFPELPTSTNSRQKVPVSGNQSLKKILGITSSAPVTNVWGGGGTNVNPPRERNDNTEADDEPAPVSSGGNGKGKKGKGKQKQTLFTLGSFPT